MAKDPVFAGWRVAVVLGGSIGKPGQMRLEKMVQEHGGVTISKTELSSILASECGGDCSGGKVVAVADSMVDRGGQQHDILSFLALQLPRVVCQSCGKERIACSSVKDFISASIRAKCAVVPPPRNAHPPAQAPSESAASAARSPGADQARNAGRKREREGWHGSDSKYYGRCTCTPSPSAHAESCCAGFHQPSREDQIH